MTPSEIIDKAAYAVGYAVLILSSIAGVLACAGWLVSYKWRKLREVIAWGELQEALKTIAKKREQKRGST